MRWNRGAGRPTATPVEIPAHVIGGAEGIRRYEAHLQALRDEGLSEDEAARQAIGGSFDAIGAMERDLLIQAGLPSDGFVIDIGCGSGRLALPLSQYLTGTYLGTDILPDLLSYAMQLVNRPDWRFEVSRGLTIPAADASADIVCFFSVFTHLRHEETYVYLQEAKRVLKPTGRIVFSFLEFAIPSHWAVFSATVAGIDSDLHLNQFFGRDAIAAWCDHLDLEIITIDDGDKPSITLTEPVTMEHGHRYETVGALGQSIAILGRR